MGTVPVMRTWVASEVVTAAELNSNIRDAVNFLLAPPLLIMSQGALVTLTTATFTPITFTTETVDTDSAHDNVTNNTRFTAKTPGYYELIGTITYDSNATGVRIAAFRKNAGGTFSTQQVNAVTAGGTQTIITTSGVIQMNGTTDYIELVGYQSSGGNLNATASSASFASRWISS